MLLKDLIEFLSPFELVTLRDKIFVYQGDVKDIPERYLHSSVNLLVSTKKEMILIDLKSEVIK